MNAVDKCFLRAVTAVSASGEAVEESPEKQAKREKVWMGVYAVGMLLMTAVLIFQNTYAASDLPKQIVTAVSTIYKDVKTIVTPIAALSFVIALLISFLSHNQKAVDAARQTAKGIIVTWVVIMAVGAIFSYADSIVSKGVGKTGIPGVKVK